MTDSTKIKTAIPNVTPRTDTTVMTDKKVRFGFKKRSAKNGLKGSSMEASISSA
jgi:hypothetical protein